MINEWNKSQTQQKKEEKITKHSITFGEWAKSENLKIIALCTAVGFAHTIYT